MRSWINIYVLSALIIIASLWRITSGEWEIPLGDVIRFLIRGGSEAEAIVIRSVRLPRLLCSLGTGGLLSVSGVILQGLLANPLAEPYTLGIASGAAFGASIGIMTGVFIMPCAFAGALSALILTFIIAFHGGHERIILAGVISNAILSSGVTFMKSVAGDKLGSIVLWLMGSFSGSGMNDALRVWSGALIVITAAYIFAPALDAMSLGRDYANVLGVNEKFLRSFMLVITSMGVALSVSSFGVIGFVGLVVPHISRGLTGASHRRVIMHSFMTGALLLCLADGAAQFLGELPAGVITALTGGPFFCYVLAKK